ncbi:MAG: tRNA (adenosine(37)-N6)-dimethylallyltransferase MiaA [Candidatus Dojkabacteria bacterium]
MINYTGKIIVIAGPTASGKSSLAIKLAKQLGGYIINGDSRQVYKYLNIGTAKPTPQEILDNNVWVIDGIRHYLFDFVDPKEKFTLFNYQFNTSQILKREKGIPILVGGSGLYIDSVIFNYNLKKNIKREDLTTLTLTQLQKKASKYLEHMTESDRKNRHRLIRVIERESLGKERGKTLKHIYFVIDIDKEILKERIKERIDEMFNSGLLEENKKLLEMGYRYSDPGLNSIGYKEFEEYFNNNQTTEQVKESIYKNTVAYAKRQRTWFKRNRESIWTDSYEDIYELASNFITGK